MNENKRKAIIANTVYYLASKMSESQKSLDKLSLDDTETVSLDEYVKTVDNYNDEISSLKDSGYNNPRRKELLRARNNYIYSLTMHGEGENLFNISKVRLSYKEIIELMLLVLESMDTTDMMNTYCGYMLGESIFIRSALNELADCEEKSETVEKLLPKWLTFFRSSDTAGYDDRIRGCISISQEKFSIYGANNQTLYSADIDVDDIDR